MSETNTGVPQEVILSEARKARQEAEGAVRSYEVDIDETKKRVEMHYDQAGQMDYELSKVNKDLKRVLSLVEEIQGRGGEVPEKLGIALKQLEEAAERLKTDIGGLNKQIDEAARKRPEIIDVDEEAKSEQREYGRRKIGDNLRKIEEYRREIYRRDRIKEFLEMSDEKLQAAMDDWAQKHKDQGGERVGIFMNFGVFLDRHILAAQTAKEALQIKLKEYPNDEKARKDIKVLLKEAEKEIEQNEELTQGDFNGNDSAEVWARDYIAGKK